MTDSRLSRLSDTEVLDIVRFEKAPCYRCGYNGPGYYQPDTHKCAADFHCIRGLMSGCAADSLVAAERIFSLERRLAQSEKGESPYDDPMFIAVNAVENKLAGDDIPPVSAETAAKVDRTVQILHPSRDDKRQPSAIYVWLVPSEEVLEQPGSWRIRKWDTEPFPEANYIAPSHVAPAGRRKLESEDIEQLRVRLYHFAAEGCQMESSKQMWREMIESLCDLAQHGRAEFAKPSHAAEVGEHPAEIALRAWQSAFGTTQLTHAKARLEAAEKLAQSATAHRTIRPALLQTLKDFVKVYQPENAQLIEQIDEAISATAPTMKQIGMAWIHKDGAVWEFNADKDREETLGMKYVPVYIADSGVKP